MLHLDTEGAELLSWPRVLPVHTDGWAHFTQNGDSFRAAFSAADLEDLLVPATPGQTVTV